MAERRISLEVTESGMKLLAHEGYDPAFGARPLKRVIQRQIENSVAVLILDGKVTEGGSVTVDDVDGHLVLTAG